MLRSISLALLGLALLVPTAGAEEAKTLKLGEKLEVTAPEKWESKQPGSRIVQYEMHSPAAEGEDKGGRLTVMRAGGSIEGNLQRWYAQFRQPDGESTEKRAKVDKKKVAGQEVVTVDISGAYVAPPFAGGGVFKGYRMKAAIVSGADGMYFFKYLGPEKSIAEGDKAFDKMIDSLKAQ